MDYFNSILMNYSTIEEFNNYLVKNQININIIKYAILLKKLDSKINLKNIK